MSGQEIERLLAMAVSPQARVMMPLSYGCGLRAGEVVSLKAGDIDREPKIIRVVQAKGRKDRHVMLPADAHELLRQWWLERTRRNGLYLRFSGVEPQPGNDIIEKDRFPVAIASWTNQNQPPSISSTHY